MQEFRCILLPQGGYCYGVEAHSENPFVELHGGFKTEAEANAYASRLRAEFSDYTLITVVRIETPVAGKPYGTHAVDIPQTAKA